jgi:hypothetical protein
VDIHTGAGIGVIRACFAENIVALGYAFMAACLTEFELVLTAWSLTSPDVMFVVEM